jgi:hypothetical protein
MPFAFNFTFSVPGISNPFSATPHTNTDQCPPSSSYVTPISFSSAPTLTLANDNPPVHRPSRLSPHSRRPLSPLPPAPTSRKRGWVPSSSEPSYASTAQTLSSGYLDTPAKYRDMAAISDQDQDQDQDQMQGGK